MELSVDGSRGDYAYLSPESHSKSNSGGIKVKALSFELSTCASFAMVIGGVHGWGFPFLSCQA